MGIVFGGGGLAEFVAAEGVAEVGLTDERVVDEFFGGAGGEDFAVGDDDGAVADFEGALDVVVGDEDGFSEGVFELADFALEVFDGDGIDAGEGFVEEDEGGVGDEGAGDFEFASFAAGEGDGFLVAGFGEAELFHEAGGFFAALEGGFAGGFEDGEEVLFDGHALEDGRFLGEVAHAFAGALIHGELGDVEAVEHDLAAVGDDHSHDHAEGGGFAGAVAAEEADDFAVSDFKGDLVNDGASGVAFDQVGGFEEDHAGCSEGGRF